MEFIPHIRATEALKTLRLGHLEDEDDLNDDMPENQMVGTAVVIYQVIDQITGKEEMYLGISEGGSWITASGLIRNADKMMG